MVTRETRLYVCPQTHDTSLGKDAVFGKSFYTNNSAFSPDSEPVKRRETGQSLSGSNESRLQRARSSWTSPSRGLGCLRTSPPEHPESAPTVRLETHSPSASGPDEDGGTHLPKPDDLLAVPRVVAVHGVPLPVGQVDLLHATQHHLGGEQTRSAGPGHRVKGRYGVLTAATTWEHPKCHPK